MSRLDDVMKGGNLCGAEVEGGWRSPGNPIDPTKTVSYVCTAEEYANKCTFYKENAPYGRYCEFAARANKFRDLRCTCREAQLELLAFIKLENL